MKLLLNKRTGNKKYNRGKEVKKMRRICELTMVVFFLVGGLSAFAESPSPIVSTTQTSTIHVEYVYNPYGVAISGTETTKTETTTVNDKGETSTTVTVSTVKSTWRGGSLKIESVNGSSDTTATDGSSSHTNFWTSYTYNEKGQLAGASGGSHTEGDRGVDANGEPIGTYESSTVDSYIIKNGQALRSSSVTTGSYYGPDGTKTSDFTTTTSYSYKLIGGSWHIMGEVSTSITTGIDGSTETITRITTYQRDANGVCTGIGQTATGTKTEVNENGGSTTYTMQNYEATFAFDAKVGWYLASESYDWVDTTPAVEVAENKDKQKDPKEDEGNEEDHNEGKREDRNEGNEEDPNEGKREDRVEDNRHEPDMSEDPALTGNIRLNGDALYMSIDNITDFYGTQSGRGRVVKLVAAKGQEAEFEALKELVADNDGSLSGYTIFGVYQGEGADNYTADTFIFYGIGYGPFQPK